MRNILTGIIISLLMISFVAGFARPAYATVPTIDLSAIAKLISQLTELKNIFGATNKTAGNTLGSLQQMILEWNFKLNNERLKKQLLDQLANQITQWILGKNPGARCTTPGYTGPVNVPCGPEGQPKFVTNWEKYTAQSAAEGWARLTTEAGHGGAEVCPYFKRQLDQVFTAQPNKFSDKTFAACSTQVDPSTVFASDNWYRDWNNLIAPNNNLIGRWLLDEDAAQLSAAQTKEAKINEVNQGFLPEKQCQNETTKTVYNPDGTSVTSFVCLDEEIKTPAGTVAALANKTATYPFDYIPNADDLSSFVSTLANSIFNLIQSFGLKNIPSGSIGSSGPASPPGGGGGGISAAEKQCADLNQPSSGTFASPSSGENQSASSPSGGFGSSPTTTPLPSNNSTLYQDCITAAQGGQNIKDFQKKFLLDQIGEEIGARQQIITAKTGTFNTLTQAVDTLNQLKTNQQNINANPKLTQYLQANPGTNTSFFNQATLDLVIFQRNQPTSTIARLQSEIINWTTRRSRVLAAQTQQEITRLFAEISPLFKIAGYKNEIDASKDELIIRQQELLGYNQILQNAQSLLAAINSFVSPLESGGVSPSFQ